MPIDPFVFGARLRKLRLHRGLSMRRLEERSGVSRGLISKFEAGSREPMAETALKLAHALNTSVERLFR